MTGQRVWIAQIMCQQRHTILAAAGEAADQRRAIPEIAEPLREAVGELVSIGAINPWCGICGAPREAWRVDLGRTAFTTIEEAKPALAELQQLNQIGNAIMGGHPGPGKAN
jgi:hypothetical protein